MYNLNYVVHVYPHSEKYGGIRVYNRCCSFRFDVSYGYFKFMDGFGHYHVIDLAHFRLEITLGSYSA